MSTGIEKESARSRSEGAIAQGRAPAADGEIVIDLNTAKLGKVKLGDQVQVLSLSAPVTDTVVGFTRFGKADSPAGFAYTHFPAAEADRLFQTNDSVDQILVAATPGLTQADLAARITTSLADEKLEVLTGADATVKRQSEFKDRLKGFTVFLTVFALVSVFVATFVIFNTFQIILSQRQREMAQQLGRAGAQLPRPDGPTRRQAQPVQGARVARRSTMSWRERTR